MMTLSCSELLADLHAAGVYVWAEPSGLAVAPRAKLTDDLAGRVWAHRDELLAFFTPGDVADVPACDSCGRMDVWQDGTGRWRCTHCDPSPGHGGRLLAIRDRMKADAPAPAPPAETVQGSPCGRCGSTRFLDVQLPDGRVRRDCMKCNRTFGFPVWPGPQTCGTCPVRLHNHHTITLLAEHHTFSTPPSPAMPGRPSTPRNWRTARFALRRAQTAGGDLHIISRENAAETTLGAFIATGGNGWQLAELRSGGID